MNTTCSYLEAIEQAWTDAFREESRLMLFGEDIRLDMQTVTLAPLHEQFPDRLVRALPLVEELYGGIAIGMSIGGLYPAFQINWSGLTPLLLDQLHRIGSWPISSGTETTLPITIRIAHDGYNQFGADYELSRSLLGTLQQIPHINIYTPSSVSSAYHLTKKALREQRPSIIFEHKALYGLTGTVSPTPPDELYEQVETGTDLTIVSWQHCGRIAQKAAQEMEQRLGLTTAVFLLNAIQPITYEPILASLKQTGRLLTVEEDVLSGGVGAEIIAACTSKLPGLAAERLAQANTVLPAHSDYAKLLRPRAIDIVHAAQALCASATGTTESS